MDDAVEEQWTTGAVEASFGGAAESLAESGIENPETLKEMSDYADGFLIGTSLMRSPSIEEAWKHLFGPSSSPSS